MTTTPIRRRSVATIALVIIIASCVVLFMRRSIVIDITGPGPRGVWIFFRSAAIGAYIRDSNNAELCFWRDVRAPEFVTGLAWSRHGGLFFVTNWRTAWRVLH